MISILHLGDITKINGAEVPIVDVVTGGSPCQDLSVAGKRAGLAGERSGLFMEQIRIVKEMREHDREVNEHTEKAIRPRFLVWENVTGAFSSNEGEDFRAVLEETARVVDPDVTIPRPADGKWEKSGYILADGYSLAWRTHDGQYWGKSIVDPSGNLVKAGTPQRRRRISLIADFGGQSAPEILFESCSMPGYPEPSEEERESASTHFARSLGTSGGTSVQPKSVRKLW